MSDYSNIVNAGFTHDDGKENAAGLQENALLVLIGDLGTEGLPIANPTKPEDLVQITANHVLKAGKSPIPCFTITEKSDLESALAGEMYSMTFQPNLTLFVPQTNAISIGQLSRIKNARLMALAKPNGEDYYIQVGTTALSAKIKSGSVKHGKGPSGERGITFVVEAFSTVPYYIYKGALPAPAAN